MSELESPIIEIHRIVKGHVWPTNESGIDFDLEPLYSDLANLVKNRERQAVEKFAEYIKHEANTIATNYTNKELQYDFRWVGDLNKYIDRMVQEEKTGEESEK